MGIRKGKMQKILAISGDPGGARTLQPVLNCLAKKGIPFVIVRHRFLDAEAPGEWPRVTPPDSNTSNHMAWFKETGCTAVIFTSSIDDKLPLSIARSAKLAGVPVAHILDHWSYYTERLQTDNAPRLIPAIYMVMDDVAYNEAESQGIPKEILKITGHPSLSGLISERDEFLTFSPIEHLKRLGFSADKKLLVFISEPIEHYASTCYVPNRKEYNEKTVLCRLCDGLQKFSSDIQIGLVPHPREDEQGLLEAWNHCKGSLDGHLLRLPKGRQTLFLADGVLGMNSILMYEAWLLGKPLLSVQPWDSHDNIINILKKEGIFYILNGEDGQRTIFKFLDEVNGKHGKNAYRSELEFHKDAPERVVQCLEGLFNRNLGEKPEA
jgi:hypothetical protein